ncbi:type II toxin-antitoxin system RelE/ParE family toxin [Streptomyces sp. P17]|uniref:type II toxin-antitoxin system RelE family toxin n=1 Tax=Streptomyces sp. P17 TaxID=3074716 RepID=UPI0028F45816|nr:type II toxin-antitoxin system RelE/ParE family toxin [Streptomyces sp. P17]MDT9697426.1 type II toxin-antitoxin system RelE/ParE family toxin [Streptomyces sp. P17]
MSCPLRLTRRSGASHPRLTERVLHRLTELQKAIDAGDAASFDIKALQGHSARWRLRVGDYRVVYTVEEGQLIVWVLAVGNRRDSYRQVP